MIMLVWKPNAIYKQGDLEGQGIQCQSGDSMRPFVSLENSLLNPKYRLISYEYPPDGYEFLRSPGDYDSFS
ncbi:hypothetical protein GCM10009092_22150 [Bowmanella denitrificans]|uniref:Uncharacterized protein n=1 Tax=Bowmanella denitrificans TaxID=366582 RepID=A0ABN0X7Z2_9ALTE